MDTKSCSNCGEVKSLVEYHKDKGCKGGHSTRCKACFREYRRANKSMVSSINKRSYERNKDARRASCKTYRQANPGKVSGWGAKYRAATIQRTPSWANDQLIAAYYMEAKRLEELTGIKFHVDHIVPLQGDLVSGLHVESNLQLLPEHENLSKSNCFDPQTFCAQSE